MTDTIRTEVAIVGGGAAGLAAAVALGRSRRDVTVIDAGQPRNAPAAGAHNLLGQEGIPPLELVAKGRKEAESYGVRIVEGRATGAAGAIDDFTVTLEDGTQVHARRIILASGLVDDLPDLPGIREGWGDTVLHCPFCHGWEVRDQRIAVLSRGEIGHQAFMFAHLSDDVTVLRHDAPEPTAEQTAQLEVMGVKVVAGEVTGLEMEGSKVRAVSLADGSTVPADAVVVAPRFNSRTEIFEALGGEAEDTPFGRQIPADPRGLTPIPGVWAAGNANQQMAMVAGAMSAGVMTGAAVHGDLLMAGLVAKA